MTPHRVVVLLGILTLVRCQQGSAFASFFSGEEVDATVGEGVDEELDSDEVRHRLSCQGYLPSVLVERTARTLPFA